MVCIYCGHETSVVNSRLQKKPNRVWRRRLCSYCGGIFTSLEEADKHTSLRVSSGSRLQPYSRDKLFISIYESCRHRKSAVEDARALTDTIESRLSKTAGGLLTKQQIQNTALDVLKRFDKAAAVHYEAYYL